MSNSNKNNTSCRDGPCYGIAYRGRVQPDGQQLWTRQVYLPARYGEPGIQMEWPIHVSAEGRETPDSASQSAKFEAACIASAAPAIERQSQRICAGCSRGVNTFEEADFEWAFTVDLGSDCGSAILCAQCKFRPELLCQASCWWTAETPRVAVDELWISITESYE